MKDTMNQLLTELKKELREEIKEELLDELTRHNAQQKMWMNKKETAAYLGISPNTFSKFLSKYPNFPVSDLAGTKRYNAKKVDEFIAITDMIEMSAFCLYIIGLGRAGEKGMDCKCEK